MRKSVIAILILVAMLLSFHYASADVDLSAMTDQELTKLRTQINEELNRRKEERLAAMEVDPDAISKKYNEWLDAYDFDSILADIESGQHGMTDECAADVKRKAGFCQTMMELCTINRDEYTGDVRITYTDLKEIGISRVYPYIDYHGLNLIVGFPYNDAFHYDQIYLKCGESITEYGRFDRDYGFDIQFEKLNGKHWEYSTLTGIFLDKEGLTAVSFREDGSVQKVDYELTDEESAAVFELYTLEDLKGEIKSRILHWNLSGE